MTTWYPKWDVCLNTYFTPLKTNMSPENQWLEDVFPTEIVPFLGDMLVFGGVSHFYVMMCSLKSS